MASSNLVRVAFVEESVYNTTPSGPFETARFTSESLSGSPDTTESQQIRVDRQSSGQVVTGLTIGGDLSFELAKETQLESFIESAMLNTWDAVAAVTVDLTIDVTAKEITRASGDWDSDGIVKGDFIELSGFADSGNNTQVQVASVDSATVISFVLRDGMVDETGSGTTYQRSDKITIGTTKKSFSMEKAFTDLSDKAIVYTGMLVNTMSLNVSYGELITGTLGFSGGSYDPVESSSNFITNGETINSAATTNTMNGSLDMPFIANDVSGTFDESTFCIQSVSTELNNNLTPQNCIGQLNKEDYTPGTASISVSLSAYLADANWSFLEKKLTQESFAIGWLLENTGGWYGFYLPAVQLSFDDPTSPGANQDVLIDASGTAKVGASGESQFVIYRAATV